MESPSRATPGRRRRGDPGGDRAFAGCANLQNIVTPESVTSIGHMAFGGCTGLAEAVIPKNATSLGDNAFSGCDSLTNVTIPASVARTFGVRNDSFSFRISWIYRVRSP